MATLVVPRYDPEAPWPTLGPQVRVMGTITNPVTLPLVMATASPYPYPCPDCGTQVSGPEDRYKTYRRCRSCGLADGREKQKRIRARQRGEDVPRRKPGPPATVYPFPCKKCGTQVGSKDERGGNWRLCKPCLSETKRLLKLQQRYGLSPDQYAQLEVQHQGICAICAEPPTEFGLVVDHNHQTGKVRGLLCLSCNWMLGNAHDDPRRLEAAVRYLIGHMSIEELVATWPDEFSRVDRARLRWQVAPE